MLISRRVLLGTAVASVLPILPARAQRPKIKIGVLTDLSGPYRDAVGPTSIVCAKQAVEEFAPTAPFDIEVITADHQNKADIGAAIARQWFDSEGVDAVADVPTSSAALAVAKVCRDKDKPMLNASATTMGLTGDQCAPTTVVWSFDTYESGKSTGGAMVKAGGDSWFFITADYAFGHSLEEQTSAVVKKAGGKVLGAVRYPFPDTTDFSSYIAQVHASGAKVLGLANAGADR